MPTDRNTAAKQRRATNHLADGLVVIDVVGDIPKAIRQARKGSIVLISDMAILGRRMDRRVDVVRQIFDKGAAIQTSSGTVFPPDQADAIIELMSSAKRVIAPEKAAKMGGWNRVSDEEKARCLKLWKDNRLTIAQLVQHTGRSYSALRNWFAKDYPRKGRPGRPRKRK